MVVRKILETTLAAGATSVSFTDTDLPNSLIRVYSNDPDLMPVTMSMSGTTLTITYESQGSNKGIAVEMVKSGLEIIDNLTSTDDEAALSAKQGKVLKDLVDGITPIRELTELDDVLVTSLADGDILKYDAENEVFKNYLMPDIPVYLGDLGDIVLDTVTSGQVLTYNGAYWTNADPEGGGSLEYSTDEKAVGKWTDGSTIYQKTYITTASITLGTSWSSAIFDVTGVDRVIKGELIRNTGNNLTAYPVGVQHLSAGFSFVTIVSGVNCQAGSYITVWYTKSV